MLWRRIASTRRFCRAVGQAGAAAGMLWGFIPLRAHLFHLATARHRIRARAVPG